MPGTVSDAGGALPVAVLVPFTVEDGLTDEVTATEEATGVDEIAAELPVEMAELAGAGIEDAAGAAEARPARRRAQRQDERRIISQILGMHQRDAGSV